MKKLVSLLILLLPLLSISQTNGQKGFFTNNVTATSIYDADADDYFSRVAATGFTITTTQKGWINDFVVGSKSDGYWTAIFNCGFLFWGNAAANAVPLKNVSPNIVWNGTLTHASGGVSTDGTSGYGDLGFTPSATQTLYNTHMGVYQRVSVASGGAPDFGCRVSNGQAEYLVVRTSTTARYGAYSTSATNGNTSASGTNGLGLLIGVRNSNVDARIYLRGNQIGNINTATCTTTLPNINAYVVGYNNAGTPNFTSSSFQYAFWTVGASLTSTQVANYNTRLETLMDNMGIGVE